MTSPALDRREITPVSNLSGQKNAKREFWVTLAALTALYVMAVAIGNRRYVWFDGSNFRYCQIYVAPRTLEPAGKVRLQPAPHLHSDPDFNLAFRPNSVWPALSIDA